MHWLSLVAASWGYSLLHYTVSHCGIFYCCGAQNLGKQASVIGLSCSVACGIFLDQGLDPGSLYWQADF